MSTGMIGIGMTGIAAAQAGLLATEHNVVNASTPGYSRQRVVLATPLAWLGAALQKKLRAVPLLYGLKSQPAIPAPVAPVPPVSRLT